ncbi:COP9 signalosome complex subunit 2 [Halocaridina rubra]|uniref:Fucosyltransferase n=1 Tax=Halocaridina rubra TaxID=373956 RepID=A0AAN8XGC0_HALRR
MVHVSLECKDDAAKYLEWKIFNDLKRNFPIYTSQIVPIPMGVDKDMMELRDEGWMPSLVPCGRIEPKFGPTTSEELREYGCPTWKCHFTYKKSEITTADAVLVILDHFKSLEHHRYHRPAEQRWVFVDVEPPTGANGNRKININSDLVNWTMSYHSHSDILGGGYGHFRSLKGEPLPFQVHFISGQPHALSQYVSELERGSSAEDVLGPSWKAFVSKPKPLAWMVSNCKGLSSRMQYVDELAKHIPIDIYGGCTKTWCIHRKSSRDLCWQNVLSWQYSFYLAFENSLCQDYITEKSYFPLVYGVIPVVYGGANYTQFLPPHSYINARHYHPKELADLLLKLHNDPVALGRYHIWRAFWKAEHFGSFCHLCQKLHVDFTYKNHEDINAFQIASSRCYNPKHQLFNNKQHPDACKEVINTNMSCTSDGS